MKSEFAKVWNSEEFKEKFDIRLKSGEVIRFCRFYEDITYYDGTVSEKAALFETGFGIELILFDAIESIIFSKKR